MALDWLIQWESWRSSEYRDVTQDGDGLPLPLQKGNHFQLKQERLDTLETSVL